MSELSGETAGRKIFRRWKFLGFNYKHDRIASDYMERWVLSTPWGMLRLHHILRSDDRAHLHDHPMSFLSLILKGGYIEHRPGPVGKDRQKKHRKLWYYPGDFVVRRAEDLHALELLDEERGAWTLVFATPYRRQWGFSTEDGWIRAGDYDAWKAMKSAPKGQAFPVSSFGAGLRGAIADGRIELPPCDEPGCDKTAAALDYDADDQMPTPRCRDHRVR